MKLQFRLRTLMIAVTLLAVPLGYVGWQAKIVRERKAWLKAHPQLDSLSFKAMLFERSLVPDDQDKPPAIQGDTSESPSVIRLWLGDATVEQLWVKEGAEAKTAAGIFPESTIEFDAN